MKFVFPYEKYDTDKIITNEELKSLLKIVLTAGTGAKATIIALIKIAAVCAIVFILDRRKKSDLEKQNQDYEISHSSSTAAHLAADDLDS